MTIETEGIEQEHGRPIRKVELTEKALNLLIIGEDDGTPRSQLELEDGSVLAPEFLHGRIRIGRIEMEQMTQDRPSQRRS